jgi:heme A synthase
MSKAIRVWAAATAAVAVLLIVAGGLVTTTKTGDTIPTWPHYRGKLHGGAWVEWSHRVAAMAVGAMSLALAAAVHVRAPRFRPLGWLVFGGVAVQGLIGAVRIFVPEALVAIVHATFAQVVFSALVALAVLVERERRDPGDAADARALGLLAAGVCFLQLVAGAVTRHTGNGLVVHVVGAVAVLLLVSAFASRLILTPLRRGGWVLISLLGVQFVLGIATWALTRREGFVRSTEAPVATLLLVSAHVAVGAGLLAACAVMTSLCRRPAALPEPALA